MVGGPALLPHRQNPRDRLASPTDDQLTLRSNQLGQLAELARISRMLSSFTRAFRCAAILADAAHAPQLVGQGQRFSEEFVGRLGTP